MPGGNIGSPLFAMYSILEGQQTVEIVESLLTKRHFDAFLRVKHDCRIRLIRTISFIVACREFNKRTTYFISSRPTTNSKTNV